MSHAISLAAFRRHLLSCFRNNVPDRIMLALSGGVDSMCLAYLLAKYKKLFHPQMHILAVTIDHGYRDCSTREANYVGDLVKKWDINHRVRKLQYDRDVHSITNFEEVARGLRYDAFEQICLEQDITSLLVAHNKDDQIETYLQRLLMNSTFFGLCSLREKASFPKARPPDVTRNIQVYRPLLSFEKASILQTCRLLSVPWFEDNSNRNIFLTRRNLLRYMVNDYVPLSLEKRPELSCLTRQSINKTIAAVDNVVKTYESQKHHLTLIINLRGIRFDESKAELGFSIPLAYFEDLRKAALARWLFEMIYPLSSSKHYHWSYAKLERQAMPRVWAWLKDPSKDLHMTYLNVSITVRRNECNAEFDIFRQTPQRYKILDYSIQIEPGDLSWFLFDRIWWIKLQGLTEIATVRYCTKSMRSDIFEAFPEEDNSMNIGIVPVIMNKAGQILAIPTMGLQKNGIFVTCKLKSTL